MNGPTRTGDTGIVTITDTIDNAIRDYGTSPDAMRWAPDAPQVTKPQPPATASVRIHINTAPIVDAFAELRRAFQNFGAALAHLERAEAHPARSVRVRQIRAAYGRRQGHR
jgi:hypothetical protein